MNVNFVALLILLLPGFWSLWIYQKRAIENLDEKDGQVLFFMGLSFGVANILLVSGICMFWDPPLPYGIELLFEDELSGSQLFWSMVLLWGASCMTGSGWWVIKGIGHIKWKPFSLGSVWKQITERRQIKHRTDHQNALDHMMTETLKGRGAFARISKIGEDPYKGKAGFFAYGNEGEVILQGSAFISPKDPIFENKTNSLIHFGSGLAIEFSVENPDKQWNLYCKLFHEAETTEGEG